MPTFKKWIKNYFGVLIILGFVYRQKTRILVYGGLVAGIYLFFVPVVQFYLESKEELAYAAEMNNLENECNFEYSCMMGYNLDCGGTPLSWKPLYREETDEEKKVRESYKKEQEDYVKRQKTLREVCKSKNLWPE